MRTTIIGILMLGVALLFCFSGWLSDAGGEAAMRTERDHPWDVARFKTVGPQPKPEEIAYFEDVRLQYVRAFRWWYTMDVYLSAAEVRDRTPALVDVSSYGVRLFGDELFFHFASNENRQRRWMINANDIVAIRYDLTRPVDIRPEKEVEGARRDLLREQPLAEDQWPIDGYGCVQIYDVFQIRPDIFLSHEDVLSDTRVLPRLLPARCFQVHKSTFLRFRPVDEKEVWILNIAQIVAVRQDG